MCGTSARSTELVEAVARHREAMLEFTRELVRLPTENPPGNEYGRAVELIAARLESLGFTDTRIEGDCVLSFVGSGDRTLHFSGHYDVVPAQHRGTIHTGRSRGRNRWSRIGGHESRIGGDDYAARALRDGDLLNCGRIGIVLVPDEETAGPRGSRDLAARGILGANGIGMLTPEPTERCGVERESRRDHVACHGSREARTRRPPT